MIKMLVVAVLVFWVPSAALYAHASITEAEWAVWLAEMGGLAAFYISTLALACFALAYLLLG